MTSRSADEVKAEFIQSFPAKTGELACELSWSITHLHLKWKNYRALFGTSPERIDLLNHAAPGFFGQLDPIMRHDVVLAITRLMDPPRTGRHKNASLGGLIELLAPHVGAAELAGWQSELALERGSQAAASSAGSIRGPRGPSHGAELSPSAVARLQSCGRGGTARTYSRPVQFDRGEVPRLARLARVDHRRWGRAAHRLAGASPGAEVGVILSHAKPLHLLAQSMNSLAHPPSRPPTRTDQFIFFESLPQNSALLIFELRIIQCTFLFQGGKSLKLFDP